MALALLASALPAAPGAPRSSPAAPPAGARRWDIPGGWFMLPDWEVRHHVVEKALGTIAVARPDTVGGGMCLTWSYQSTPLSPKELADGGPAYLTLLKSFLKGAGLPDGLKLHGDNEVEVICGHAAVVMRFAAGGTPTDTQARPAPPRPRRGSNIAAEGGTETALAVWDCPQSKRTFATMCFAPQKSIAGQLFFAVSKYAACHALPVQHDASGPLAVSPPADWKTVELAPTQHVLASPDRRSAVYLFALAPSQAQRVTIETATSVVDTVGRLAGKLERREPPEILTDPRLQHDVARVKAVVQVDKRSALATFEVWHCPVKQRLYTRAALSEAADGLEKAREILDSVRCH